MLKMSPANRGIVNRLISPIQGRKIYIERHDVYSSLSAALQPLTVSFLSCSQLYYFVYLYHYDSRTLSIISQ